MVAIMYNDYKIPETTSVLSASDAHQVEFWAKNC